MKKNNEHDNELAKELIYCGIGQHESVLHFGACDSDLFLLETIDEFGLDIQYTAVDTKEEIETLFSDFQPMEKTHQWITVNESMQEYIDNIGDERYNWTLITGVFDKPLYSERQYQFIDTVIRECLNFSDNVIFTIKEQTTSVFKYSMLYLFQHFNTHSKKFTVKRLTEGKYIFCFTN
jgi:hypothetical protein